MNKRTFYDIHMHAFNLSHPSISVFVRRALREATAKLLKPNQWHRAAAVGGLGVVLAALWLAYAISLSVPWAGRKVRELIRKAFAVVKRQVASVLNMLAVFENDVGSMLLVMENCLRDTDNQLLRPDNSLCVENNELYTEIVLTPLMMDFGHKGKTPLGKKRLCHYDVPAEKPIVEQVIDVFTAIRKYMNTAWSTRLQDDYPELTQETKRVFRIYPFLGLNTANYSLEELGKLLDKYFSDYRGLKEDLDRKMGQFDGQIGNLDSNFFAGIKVYPPLGFDPWPEEGPEREKVKAIYEAANRDGIPITCHGGSGGFKAIPTKTARQYADIAKWRSVLAKYGNLKLNIAHFPVLGESHRRKETRDLVLDHENVYVDISCLATKEKYYRALRECIDEIEDDKKREKFQQRLLFGSDFAVNLLWIESYNAYVDLFSSTQALDTDQKRLLCSTNPERFLFNPPPGVSGRNQ